MTTSFDRFAGVLVAAAAGDALGAGYEFGAPVPAEVPIGMRGQGMFAPGEWTDDTAQLLAIAVAAASGHDLTTPEGEDAVAAQFYDWYQSPARDKDIGIHTAAVFAAVAAAETEGLGERFRRQAEAKELKRPGSSGGNGALMRTAAVALALHEMPADMVRVAMRLASMTHDDPRSSQSCAVWCLAIRRALHWQQAWDDAQVRSLADALADDVRHYLPDVADYWIDVLESAFGRQPHEFYGVQPPNGYSVTALGAAWAAVTGTSVPDRTAGRHLRLAIESAVRGGGDTDTVACIAGALLGAMWGYSTVPLDWRRRIFGWPDYRDHDLLRVADAIYQGRVDHNVWPHASHVSNASWANTDSVAVHPHDDGVIIGGSDVAYGRLPLPGGSVDAVVSLCRVGRDDLAHLGLDDEAQVQVRLIDTHLEHENPHLALVMEDAADLVAAFRAEGKRVLLHCVAAQSRTPTVAALYSVRHLGIAPDVALKQVVASLPAAQPNSALASVVLAGV